MESFVNEGSDRERLDSIWASVCGPLWDAGEAPARGRDRERRLSEWRVRTEPEVFTHIHAVSGLRLAAEPAVPRHIRVHEHLLGRSLRRHARLSVRHIHLHLRAGSAQIQVCIHFTNLI